MTTQYGMIIMLYVSSPRILIFSIDVGEDDSSMILRNNQVKRNSILITVDLLYPRILRRHIKTSVFIYASRRKAIISGITEILIKYYIVIIFRKIGYSEIIKISFLKYIIMCPCTTLTNAGISVSVVASVRISSLIDNVGIDIVI